jgi:hypothetical protein
VTVVPRLGSPLSPLRSQVSSLSSPLSSLGSLLSSLKSRISAHLSLLSSLSSPLSWLLSKGNAIKLSLRSLLSAPCYLLAALCSLLSLLSAFNLILPQVAGRMKVCGGARRVLASQALLLYALIFVVTGIVQSLQVRTPLAFLLPSSCLPFASLASLNAHRSSRRCPCR